jgi:hypothetical protein
MLTEIAPTYFAIRINGVLVAQNIPSRQLAEATVYQLPQEQRMIAEIVPMTPDGRSLLLG